MRTILDVYRAIYESNESPEHIDKMKHIAIVIGKIGQKIKMNRCTEKDGEELISIARSIESEYV